MRIIIELDHSTNDFEADDIMVWLESALIPMATSITLDKGCETCQNNCNKKVEEKCQLV